MSRKAPTFAQLAAYIGRDASPGSGTAFVRNVYASGADERAVVAQFLDNYRYLPERKGGNALYHEVIVLEPQTHLASEAVEAALHELAERYCQQRAPHQLAWGRVHRDTEFPHIHLMISANAVRSERRVRMERAYFGRVQRDLERWRAEHLPELRARVIYGHEHERQSPKQPVQEGEMVRRTQAPSRKRQVFEQVKSAIERATDRAESERHLAQAGFLLYQRGRSWGVVDQHGGKRYRLQTLGLLAAFERLPERQVEPAPRPGGDGSPDRREAELLRQRLQREANRQLRDLDRDDDRGR